MKLFITCFELLNIFCWNVAPLISFLNMRPPAAAKKILKSSLAAAANAASSHLLQRKSEIAYERRTKCVQDARTASSYAAAYKTNTCRSNKGSHIEMIFNPNDIDSKHN